MGTCIELVGDTMLKLKYKTLLIIIFLLLVLSLQVISAQELPLMDTIIMVDPGHGGRDSGTMYQNILEKDINLEISKVLEKRLTELGAIVYLTRTQDVDLSSIYDSGKKRGDLYRRLLLIKKKQSDLYLSIHINWYQNSANKGAEVLYNSINSKNELLATAIMDEFREILGSKREVKPTDLYMYRNTTTPGVLIECGYLSNPSERSLLQDEKYQQKIADAITKGVITYLKNNNQLKNIL